MESMLLLADKIQHLWDTHTHTQFWSNKFYYKWCLQPIQGTLYNVRSTCCHMSLSVKYLVLIIWFGFVAPFDAKSFIWLLISFIYNNLFKFSVWHQLKVRRKPIAKQDWTFILIRLCSFFGLLETKKNSSATETILFFIKIVKIWKPFKHRKSMGNSADTEISIEMCTSMSNYFLYCIRSHRFGVVTAVVAKDGGLYLDIKWINSWFKCMRQLFFFRSVFALTAWFNF